MFVLGIFVGYFGHDIFKFQKELFQGTASMAGSQLAFNTVNGGLR